MLVPPTATLGPDPVRPAGTIALAVNPGGAQKANEAELDQASTAMRGNGMICAFVPRALVRALRNTV